MDVMKKIREMQSDKNLQFSGASSTDVENRPTIGELKGLAQKAVDEGLQSESFKRLVSYFADSSEELAQMFPDESLELAPAWTTTGTTITTVTCPECLSTTTTTTTTGN